MFISWYEHLYNVSSVIGCLTVADYAIEFVLLSFCTKVINLRQTTWFFLHALANACICVCSVNSFVNTLFFPGVCANGDVFTDRSMFGVSSVWPLTISNGIHLYHMYGGFSLSSSDYFHHLVFIPTLSFPGQYYKWGSLSNSQALFVTGLPGGIDYFLLGLVKTGVIAKKYRKAYQCAPKYMVTCSGYVVYQHVAVSSIHDRKYKGTSVVSFNSTCTCSI